MIQWAVWFRLAITFTVVLICYAQHFRTMFFDVSNVGAMVQQQLSFKMFQLNILRYVLFLGKRSFKSLMNSLPIFVSTFWLYGDLDHVTFASISSSVLSTSIIEKH